MFCDDILENIENNKWERKKYLTFFNLEEKKCSKFIFNTFTLFKHIYGYVI